MTEASGSWLDVGGVAEVTKRRKFVVDHGEAAIVVLAHGGGFYALDNVCIHKQRELVKGVILGNRIICPGHQWAYQLGTGWEAKMNRCQPTYDVRVNGDRVEVDVRSRRVLDAPPACDDAATTTAG
jgi:nitrite reductase (NADH) small subunit